MKAYVKVRKGNFPDVNYYLAWKGFSEIGFEVVKFEEEDIDKLEVTAHTPVFGGVGTCRTIIKKFFDWDYVGINPYPDELSQFMNRTVRRGKWSELRKEALDKRLFVKPVIQKQFIGDVMNSILNTIKMAKVQEDHEVYVCDPVDFKSEFRVYVHDNEVVGVKHYHGDWSMVPLPDTIKEMIRMYKPVAPVAYGLDIGIIIDPQVKWHRDTLVEINDGICLGNYGLDPANYAEMITERWMELITNRKVEVRLQSEIKEHEETGNRLGWGSKHADFYRDLYYKPNDYNGKNYKDLIVSDEARKVREQALKDFTKDMKFDQQEEV